MRALSASRTSVTPGGVLAGNWARDPLWKNARAVPSLDLRFAENKSLTDAKTGASLISFTRASTGTYVGSDGLVKTATTNEARFDHNPTTGESLGLLVEEARTNLLLRSEEFDNASWTANEATITANQIAAPNGTTTADLFTTSATTGVEHYILQSFTVAASTAYTASVYAKAGTGSIFDLQYRVAGAWAGGNVLVGFNLSTQVVTITSGTATASITPVGNGWFRCQITATSSVAGGSPQFRIATGDGGGTLYLWGAQLEVGAFPSSYIPTTSATVTRAADVASITGTNFSSFYNQTEGTFYSEGSIKAIESGKPIIGTNLANFNPLFFGSSSTLDGDYRAVGDTLSSISAAVITGAFKATSSANTSGNFAGSYNGTVIATLMSALSFSSVTSIQIGSRSTGATMTGTIKRLAFWPVRLANPTLQSITTP
jgi:hypothetical protein